MGGLDVWRIAVIAVGAVVGVVGLWVLRLARRDLRDDGAHDNSGPTRLTVGLCCLFWGYHGVVWALPAGMRSLSVPIELWWVAVGATAVAVGAGVLGDWLDGRGQVEDGSPRGG